MREVRIATYANEPEARFWQDLLAERGILSVLVPLGIGPGGGGGAFWQPHELRVLPKNAERARELLGEAAG